MSKKRYTEEQIIGFLKAAESGRPVAELCRQHGFSNGSFYAWKKKFGGSFGCEKAINVTNPDAFAQYREQAQGALDKHSGSVVSVSMNVRALEGAPLGQHSWRLS